MEGPSAIPVFGPFLVFALAYLLSPMVITDDKNPSPGVKLMVAAAVTMVVMGLGLFSPWVYGEYVGPFSFGHRPDLLMDSW